MKEYMLQTESFHRLIIILQDWVFSYVLNLVNTGNIYHQNRETIVQLESWKIKDIKRLSKLISNLANL